MADLLFTTDLENASKEQLKALVKRVREETGKPIDLRKADAIALRQYLQDYLTAQATTEALEPESKVTHTLSDFEGITDAPLGDWFASCPLTCDPCNYQVCKLPERKLELEIAFCDGCEKRCELVTDPEPELEIPESFNATTRRTIDILLQFGTAYGSLVNRAWIEGILKDASWRSTIPGSITEKLLLSDPIYYGLAGIAHDSIALYSRIVKTPEEFGDIPEEARQGADFYRTIGSMFGADKIAQISAFHTIRDHLNYLQVRLGISSLEERSYAIRDKLFTTIDYDSQMALLPSDRATLDLEAEKIAAYFQLLTTDYEVFRVYDDETEKPLPEGFDLARQAAIAAYAWIYAESFCWILQSGGGYIGHHTEQLHPDRIELCLSFWDGSDYDSFLRLIAYHPDPSRRPWLANQSR